MNFKVTAVKIFKDMDDNQFYATVWILIATLFVLVISWISYGGMQEDKLVHDLVLKGHDPIELACLFNSDSSLEASCMLLAQAKAKVIAAEAPE